MTTFMRNYNEVPSYASDPAGMDHMLTCHMLRALKWAHLPATERNVNMAKSKARQAHMHKFGKSNLTDWRITQMEESLVIKMIATVCQHYRF